MSEQTELVREVRVIRWEDPPPQYAARQRRCQYEMRELRAQLMARPGKWAVVGEHAQQTAAASVVQLVKARLAWMPGQVEAVTRRVDGQYWAYARWVPEVSR